MTGLAQQLSRGEGGLVTPGNPFLNKFFNPDFTIWQRGTSVALSSGYTYLADRWCSSRTSTAGTTTISQSANTQDGYGYSLSIVSTDANPSINYRFESIDSWELAGKYCTVSFYANAVDSSGAPINWAIITPTALDNYTSINTSSSGVVTATPVSGNWTKYSFSFTAPISALGFQVQISRGSASGTSTTTLYDKMVCSIGNIAVPFAPMPVSQELQRCQRYFELETTNTWGPRTSTNGSWLLNIPFKVTKRAAPTMVVTSGPPGTPTAGNIYFDGSIGTNMPIAASNSTINNVCVQTVSPPAVAGCAAYFSFTADIEIY